MIKTILLAEDSADDEFFFRRTLKAAGVENPLQVMRDGEQVIAYLGGEGAFADRERHPLPVVLFLDVKMPRAGGKEVLEWLKTRPQFQKMLVVMLTSVEEIRQLEIYYTLGAHTFLPKLFSPADLQDVMRHFEGYWMRSN